VYGDKEKVALFVSNATKYSRVACIRRKLIYVFLFLRIELVVKLVLEVKSAVDFLAPYTYDYRVGPSSKCLYVLKII